MELNTRNKRSKIWWPYGAEVGIFKEIQANAMAVGTLAPCVNMASAAIVLNRYDYGFQGLVPSLSPETIEYTNISLYFLKTMQSIKS